MAVVTTAQVNLRSSNETLARFFLRSVQEATYVSLCQFFAVSKTCPPDNTFFKVEILGI